MNPDTMRRSLVAPLLLTIVCVSLACSSAAKQTATTPSASPPPTTATPAPTPLATAGSSDTSFPSVVGSDPVTFDANPVFGSGPFTMRSTRTGLADLVSYQARLTLNFDGTKGGQPSQWSRVFVMQSTKDPPIRQLTSVTTGDAADPVPQYRAETGGVSYEKIGKGACTADVTGTGDSLAKRFEPAGFLSGVAGADPAGNDTINGTPAAAYTFDEHALGQSGLTASTGRMSVATAGGYILKYQLVTKAGAKYFGEGIDGTLTWDYELTGIKQPITLQLPDDCPPGLVSAPQLADESNLENLPGVLTYDTTASLLDILSFYQQELPKLAWAPGDLPTLTDTTEVIEFIQGASVMTVTATIDNGITTVQITLNPADTPQP